ncbi:MAG: hypothetical protein WDN23_11100 [Edaphobacter sp.]
MPFPVFVRASFGTRGR